MHRPSTPEPVKRALRQEACFGCCACGNPIFQYQHIVEYAKEAHFRIEDMMTLCPEHHDQATRGVLDEPVQRAMKARPHNCERGLAGGQLSVRQRSTELDLGGHLFMASAGRLITVGDEPLLTTGISEYGTLLLTLKLRNEQDQLVAEILDNEWISEDPLPWDIDFSYRKLMIRSEPRKISLSIDAGIEPIAIRGTLWSSGRLLTVDNDGLHTDDEAHFIGGGKVIGFAIEMDSKASGGTGFRLVPQPPELSEAPRSLRRLPEPGRNDRCPCGSGLKYKRCHGLG